MRYNKNIPEYNTYIETLKKETEIQKRYYREIGITRNKIKKTEKEIFNGVSDEISKRLQKLIGYYNHDLDKYSNEIQNSRARQKFIEQKLCNHDFGLVTNEYIDDDGKKYQSGFCLECDQEFNDVEGQIFIHSIYMNKSINLMSFDSYKRKLTEYKIISLYAQNDYDYTIGENIVNAMMVDKKRKVDK